MTVTDTSWRTPSWILELVCDVGPIGLDPCTTEDNPTRVQVFCTPDGSFTMQPSVVKCSDHDGLAQPWGGYGLVYVNCPYSRHESPRWAAKIATEARAGVEIVALLPARVDTGWWHLYIAPLADAVCFLRGRPKHVGADGKVAGVGKFPSLVAYFGDRTKVFARVFGPHGWIVETRRQETVWNHQQRKEPSNRPTITQTSIPEETPPAAAAASTMAAAGANACRHCDGSGCMSSYGFPCLHCCGTGTGTSDVCPPNCPNAGGEGA